MSNAKQSSSYKPAPDTPSTVLACHRARSSERLAALAWKILRGSEKWFTNHNNSFMLSGYK